MFQDVEAAMIAQLRAKLPQSVGVHTIDDLARVPELRNKAPAVFVAYEGFALGESPANVPTVQAIDLRFSVVVTTKSARGNGAGTESRDEAADLCGIVIESLIGLPVGESGKRLRLSASPGAEYDAGYSYVPIGFTCPRHFRAKH